MGWCEMVGDYYDDSSVKENLNLLLHLTRVEANVDSKMSREQGSLKGFFKGRRLGAPQQVLAAVGCVRCSKVYTKSVHSRVVQRLREIQGSRENRVDSS